MNETEVVLVTAILEESLNKLDILNLLAPAMYQKDEFLNDDGEGFPTVINECHRLFPDDLHNQVHIMDENSLKWKIFHSGRIYLENVLKSMLEELQTNKSCTNTINEIIEKEKLLKLEEVQSELKLELKEEKLQALQAELNKIKIIRTENIKKNEEILKSLKKTTQKTKTNNLASEKYSKKHEQVRLEQAKKKFKTKLEDLKENIEKMKMRLEDERRIHTEVESFCNHEYQCKENELQSWIEKYNKETSEIEAKIIELQATKEKQFYVYKALVERHNEYVSELKEDEDEKRAERERIKLEESTKKSALLIQCWWRAVMVRRFLGQFRSLKRILHQRKLKAKALAKAASKKTKR